jgi:hypothetical protein
LNSKSSIIGIGNFVAVAGTMVGAGSEAVLVWLLWLKQMMQYW